MSHSRHGGSRAVRFDAVTSRSLRAASAYFLLAAIAGVGGNGSSWAHARADALAGASSHFLIVENAGQFARAVRFRVETSQGILWVTDDGLWITQFERRRATVTPSSLPHSRGPGARSVAGPTRGVNLDLTFPGHLAGASLVPSDPLPTRTNYFLGPDARKWRGGVRTYGAVTWRALFPGLSLTLADVGGRPALEVRTVPGTGPAALRLRVRGARAIRPSPDGRLVAETAIGPVALPVIIDDGQALVARVSRADAFFTGSTVLRRPSVVVPARLGSTGQGLLYGTLLGGSGDDYYNFIRMARGQDGSTYVAGTTFSTDFPTTPGAFDTSYNGGGDVYVSKLDPTGSSLVYSTFLGGSALDDLWALALGPDGSLYVGGRTSSEDFPTTPGAFDTTYAGGDGFISKLDPSGSSLVYSTFLGGSVSNDTVAALALAPDGTVSATGNTSSTDFPTTPGAFDTSCMDDDAFVSALNAWGSALLYSTCLGGTGGDTGQAIALGPDGTAYVTGVTSSSDFPTTPGAFDQSFNGGSDAFLARLNASGRALVFSTFLGGRTDDYGTAITLDGARNIFLTGNTNSSDFPTTPGAYDPTINSTIFSDTFVTKLDSAGSSLVYSTFLGGNDVDGGFGLVPDRDGSLTVTGETHSSNFPTTANAFDRTMGGVGDVFVSRFDPTGADLLYSSFLGGTSHVFERKGMSVTAGPGLVDVAGATASADFPTTPGAFDPTYNGAFDAFVVILRVAPTMHVAWLTPGYKPAGTGYLVGARIRIVSATSTAVPGAAVTVEVEYPDGSNVELTATTGQTGIAVVRRQVTDTGTYTFTVLEVVRTPVVYDASQNNETSDSVTIPRST